MNLLQFLSRAVFISAKTDTEMESVSLTDLCVINHLSRGKAARLFYQTLVLVGADYLTAYQDDSGRLQGYGEITLTRVLDSTCLWSRRSQRDGNDMNE